MEIVATDWHPLYRELALLIGEDKTIIMFNEYKGTQVAFPMRLVSRTAVKKYVEEMHPFKRVNQLARETGYSERNIRRILKELDIKRESGE